MQNLNTNHKEVLKKIDVLVVDDISAVRNIMNQILRNLGVGGRIDEAADGLEAWEIMQKCNYDVVICDIRMPRMNGLELKERLRAHPKFGELPFLMITGEVSEEMMESAVKCKWDGYLLKPFPSAVLEKCLLKLLAKADKF